jgi:hypothetical protein
MVDQCRLDLGGIFRSTTLPMDQLAGGIPEPALLALLGLAWSALRPQAESGKQA